MMPGNPRCHYWQQGKSIPKISIPLQNPITWEDICTPQNLPIKHQTWGGMTGSLGFSLWVFFFFSIVFLPWEERIQEDLQRWWREAENLYGHRCGLKTAEARTRGLNSFSCCSLIPWYVGLKYVRHLDLFLVGTRSTTGLKWGLLGLLSHVQPGGGPLPKEVSLSREFPGWENLPTKMGTYRRSL